MLGRGAFISATTAAGRFVHGTGARLLARATGVTVALARRPLSALAEPGSSLLTDPSKIRNVAIIAHVDHGKTTLVDRLLQESESAVGSAGSTERAMDSGGLEQERGITIMSKTTRIEWGGHVINLVDTPGHADFGGEVERVLSMVDGAILLVDATEGVMAQTKFVVQRAIKQNLELVLVLNKADRDSARLNGEVESEVFDLLCNLGADEDQLEYPCLYASAKQGWAVADMAERAAGKGEGMSALLERVLAHVPPPNDEAKRSEPFTLAVNSIRGDNYLGRMVIGKIESGTVAPGDKIQVLPRSGAAPGPASAVTKVFCMRGLDRVELPEGGGAGDIVCITGAATAQVADTIAAVGVTEPLETPPLTPPTVAVEFGANDGPMAGRCKTTTHMTSSQIRARLEKEVENNVTMTLHQSETNAEGIEVHARGELQIGILIEEMRRDGYEMRVSPPRVVMRTCPETGDTQEPVEEVTVDVQSEHAGLVIDRFAEVKGEMKEFKEMGTDGSTGIQRVRLVFHATSRGLMGLRSAINSATHGTAVITAIFDRYEKMVSGVEPSRKGRLVAAEHGTVTSYALDKLGDRGVFFVTAGDQCYPGLVVGESNKDQELVVNVATEKKLTNVRTMLKDDKQEIAPAQRLNVEDMLVYMSPDEMIEVTPETVRLRKRILDAGERARIERNKRNAKKAK